MNAMTEIVVCPERMLTRLCEDMKFIVSTSIYSSTRERLEALNALYGTHLYVQGIFSAEKNALGAEEFFFAGSLCGSKHNVRIF